MRNPSARLAMLAFVVAGVVGCGAADTAADPETPAEPLELVLFVYDRSTSIPDHSLELAGRLTTDRIMQLDHGDRLGGMRVLQLSLAEERQSWRDMVPGRTIEEHEIARDSVARIRFLRDATVLLGRLSDHRERDDVDGTDILSTFHDISAELRAYPGHEATVYVFSDMLQSNRQIDMEGLRLMPPDGWVADAKESGTLPDLGGVCVVVVGARVDTQAAQRIKAFWDDYFQATGATLLDSNYMLRPVRLPMNPCG